MERTDEAVLVLVDTRRHLAVMPAAGEQKAWCGALLNDAYFAAWLWEPQLQETCRECDAGDFPGLVATDGELWKAADGLAELLHENHGLDIHEHAGSMQWCVCGVDYRDCQACTVIDNLEFARSAGNLSCFADALNDYLEMKSSG